MHAVTSQPPVAKKRLLVVDDHPIMRQGLKQLLDLEPDLVVAGLAASAAQALMELRDHRFDLAIVDVSLGGVSGIELLKNIRECWPAMLALTLSMHDENLYAERALRAGSRGYVMKQEATDRIVDAVRCVLDGGLYASDEIKQRLAIRPLSATTEKSGRTGIVALLSDRELEVFRLLGRGWGTRAVAEEMRLSIKTVETYRAHIKDKLHLKNAPELMRWAVNWVSAEEKG